MSIIYWVLFLSLVCVCARAASPVVVPFSNTNIQYIGRTHMTTNGAIFSWSGVTISAKFSGSSSISAIFGSGSGESYFHVLVDGVAQPRIHVTSAAEYPLASGLSSGSHTVTLVRLNEANQGATMFTGFGLATGGSLQTPDARPNKRIEFIGDSITCGYGDLGTFPCAWSPETEDVYQSHGPIAARALGADVMVTAWSGYGLVRGYSDPNPTPADTLPPIYNQAVGGSSGDGTWDFAKWIPHAVVINLGTNDFSTQPHPSQSQYTTAYVSFVNAIKQYYSSAVPEFFIICGPMESGYCDYAASVAQQVGGHFLNESGIATSLGCDYHPSVTEQTNMGIMEAHTIGSVLNWPITTPSAPPTPSPTAQDIYIDSFSAGWSDYSWANHSLVNTNPVHSGKYSISFTLGKYTGLFFYVASALYLSDTYTFSFWVHGGSLSGVPLQVSLSDGNSGTVGQVLAIPTPVVAGSWVQETFTASAFAVPAGTPCYGFVVQVNSETLSGTIYVDDVKLTVHSAASSTTSTPSPTTSKSSSTTSTPSPTTSTPSPTTSTPSPTTVTFLVTVQIPTTCAEFESKFNASYLASFGMKEVSCNDTSKRATSAQVQFQVIAADSTTTAEVSQKVSSALNTNGYTGAQVTNVQQIDGPNNQNSLGPFLLPNFLLAFLGSGLYLLLQ